MGLLQHFIQQYCTLKINFVIIFLNLHLNFKCRGDSCCALLVHSGRFCQAAFYRLVQSCP
jgi:hypothetical protein